MPVTIFQIGDDNSSGSGGSSGSGPWTSQVLANGDVRYTDGISNTSFVISDNGGTSLPPASESSNEYFTLHEQTNPQFNGIYHKNTDGTNYWYTQIIQS